jgi:hypothetical protein
MKVAYIGKYCFYASINRIGFFKWDTKEKVKDYHINLYLWVLGALSSFWMWYARFLIWWDEHIYRLKR